MIKKVTISALFLGFAIIGFLVSRRGPEVRAEQEEAISSVPVMEERLESAGSSGPSSSSVRQASHPVTLQEIADLSYSTDSNDFYLRLTSELMAELFQLQAAKDKDRITSRLVPIAQKFYYLNKAHQNFEDAAPFSLPESFRREIQDLEELWESNNDLAQAADNVFAQLDLLDCEHVPYQLRGKVRTQ